MRNVVWQPADLCWLPASIDNPACLALTIGLEVSKPVYFYVS